LCQKIFQNLKQQFLKYDISNSILLIIIANVLYSEANGQQTTESFQWPNGNQAAISLTFDDARVSQVDTGIGFLARYNIKATFFVVPTALEERLEGWRKAVMQGHEIGNHSMHHPCTGNFLWSRINALENYTLSKMRDELLECNKRIKELLGITPEVFAYPCGQKFVGRDTGTKSYVPLVAKMFVLGRGWKDEAMVDPLFSDFSQVGGIEMDGKNFDEILPLIEDAKKNGQWLILAGHEIGETGMQTTRLAYAKAVNRICKRIRKNKIWIAPAGLFQIHNKTKTATQ
jgi:peptidoglycan/xylan/chitin deacetylase (PgdA/CDA1 family)